MKTNSRLPVYWAYQFAGWGAIGPVNIVYSASFNGQSVGSTHVEMTRLAVWVVSGLFLTHLMRAVIRRMRLLDLKPKRQVLWIFSLTLFFSAISCAMVGSVMHLLSELHHFPVGTYDPGVSAVRTALSSMVNLLIWNTVYFLVHYVAKSRKQETDALRMVAAMKELQLKKIMASINPHFLFNALNSIRALVNEDPDRARAAVSSLGNILRTSLQSQQQETVALESELAIVGDYLALQKMRFEERLSIEYDIDRDTLKLPVPVMLLQTLVENAIKHGVSRYIEKGRVSISSRLRDGRFELAVQNTGRLDSSIHRTGFGWSSTSERLSLLFGDVARFEIRQVTDSTVEARVSIPTDAPRSVCIQGMNGRRSVA